MYNQSFTLEFESDEDRIRLINLLHDANPTHVPGFSLAVAGIGVSILLPAAGAVEIPAVDETEDKA